MAGWAVAAAFGCAVTDAEEPAVLGRVTAGVRRPCVCRAPGEFWLLLVTGATEEAKLPMCCALEGKAIPVPDIRRDLQ